MLPSLERRAHARPAHPPCSRPSRLARLAPLGLAGLTGLAALAGPVGLAACGGAEPARLDARPALRASAAATPSVRAEADDPARELPTAQDFTPVTVPVEDKRPKIGSVGFRTWIWATPDRSKKHIAVGAVRLGTAVALKSETPVKGSGCNYKWYEIEPYGYVCSDDSTTRDFDHVYWKALASLTPKPGPLPYKYAYSLGAPMYSRVPTEAEQKGAEWGMGPKKKFLSLGKWAKGHEVLVQKDVSDPKDDFRADGEQPWFLKGHEGIPGSRWNPAKPKVRTIPAGSGFAYARAFEAAGRLWLLTPDLFLIPADRALPYNTSSFHGVTLDAGKQLPLAWVRGDREVPKWKKVGETFEKAGGTWARQAHVFLTGAKVKIKKRTYWETKEQGLYVEDDDAVSIAQAAPELPRTIGENDKWIKAHLLDGVMVAHVGRKPVFTTMWSPGKGGVPAPGNTNHERYATTELGLFEFQWKDKAETMSPDEGAPTVFWFADVPHIQYVHAPLAMHVSYWHDRFGHPMSAECLNLSPKDGEWLFQFTDPPVPPGWGSVRPSKLTGKGSRILIVP
jgi:hypothetical protein